MAGRTTTVIGNTRRLEKAGLFALLCCGCILGCSEPRHEVSRIIRLAEPDRIESVESEHEDLLNGRRPLFHESEAFVRLQAGEEWHLFQPIREQNGEEGPPPKAFLSEEGDTLILGPGTGVAKVIPVKSDTYIQVECRGELDLKRGLKASVVPLSSREPLPEEGGTESLFDYVRRWGGRQPTPLKPSMDGKSASAAVSIRKMHKALLFLYTNAGTGEGRLDSTWMCYSEPRHEFLYKRRRSPPEHPALALHLPIEATVRPSFLLPPRTSVLLKEIEIPEAAEFRCALGVAGALPHDLLVTLEGMGRDGEAFEIFRKRLTPDAAGWLEIKQDLSQWSGRDLKFRLTSRWDGQKESKPGAGTPLVCCGSPAVHYMEPSEEEQGFNLVLLSLDMLRADHLGCYGYARPVSPNMDRFSAECIQFDNAYAQAPYTLPSHASLFTSLFPSSHGVQDIKDRLPASADLLAEVLAREGLDTASFNGGSTLSHEFGFNRGFDLYCEVDPLGDRFLHGRPLPNKNRLADGSAGSLERAFSWMEERGKRRFFLFLHTFMIHDYTPPQDLAEEFIPGFGERFKTNIASFKKVTPDLAAQPEISDQDLELLVDLYDAGIKAADRMVEELLARLRRSGLLDRTIVVLTSDHGEEFMEHGGLWHTRTVYDELIRVPLLIHVPDLAGGARVEARMNQVDLMPTLLELMNIDAPKGMQGRSLLPLLHASNPRDRTIFAETVLPNQIRRRCIIHKGVKYIEGELPSRKTREATSFELFLLNEDPGERRSVIEEYPEQAGSLKEMMDRMKKNLLQVRKLLHAGEKPSDAISESLKEILRQQGYL